MSLPPTASARLHLNGVNGATGDYGIAPVDPEAIAAIARGEKVPTDHLQELQARARAATVEYLGVVAGVDSTDLAQAGWGVVFAHDADPRVREALGPLLEHRRAQAAAVDERLYREFTGPDGYRRDESNVDFLVRHGVGPGQPADPNRMPYYLMIVGDPETIPFRFQYQLDVVYAVGRVCFDEPDAYARYAQSVVAAETTASSSRRALFFGTRNPDDPATRLSSEHLVAPLVHWASLQNGWTVDSVVGDDATKERLSSELGGETEASLLFTATHGMEFPKGDARQGPHQGALLCQDWPGPRAWRKGIPEDFYLSGDDVSEHANLAGLIALLFACYGCGTPTTDDFVEAVDAPRIAPHAFVGRLPQRLLDRPKGSALAVIGHVERAWSYSFVWPRLGEQLDVYKSTLLQLLDGLPLGAAMEYFNLRYAALTTDLQSEKEDIAYGKVADPVALSGLWTARNDARNYIVLGDPAVRLSPAVA